MNYRKFESKWLSIEKSNQFFKLVCIGLLATNFITLIGWLKKDQAIILIPAELSEKAEISRNKSSEGYKKAWAMYATTLLGNITPDNADFVLESLKNMVTGEVNETIAENIAEELDTLKQEKVSSSFEIVRVVYEPETDIVFVNGRNKLIGPGGKTNATDQTMEFIIDVKQYSPIISHIASYAGQPRIKKVKDREEQKAKATADRQKKIDSGK